jgi:peptidoglycan/xylan/chitin deacetylase (PgdA/CDA1 family)
MPMDLLSFHLHDATPLYLKSELSMEKKTQKIFVRIRQKMTDLIAHLLNLSGLLDSYMLIKSKLSKSIALVLLHHRVNPSSAEAVTPQSFEKQLQYLCRFYEIIDLETLANYLHRGETFPSKAAIITFDDGFKDNYIYAYPLLRKYDCPATIFLTVDSIDTKVMPIHEQIIWFFTRLPLQKIEIPSLGKFELSSRLDRYIAATEVNRILRDLQPQEREKFIKELSKHTNFEIPMSITDNEVFLSWQEIREMSSNKITFGSHTLTHPYLPILTPDEAQWEINYSKKRIEEKLKQRITTFSYPFGGYNRRIMEIVQSSGYLCAVTTIPKAISQKTNPYELGRFSAAENFDKFKLVLTGLLYDFKNYLKLKGGYL